jgi:hypothetical protein
LQDARIAALEMVDKKKHAAEIAELQQARAVDLAALREQVRKQKKGRRLCMGNCLNTCLIFTASIAPSRVAHACSQFNKRSELMAGRMNTTRESLNQSRELSTRDDILDRLQVWACFFRVGFVLDIQFQRIACCERS